MISVQLYLDLIKYVGMFSTKFVVEDMQEYKFKSFRVEWDGDRTYKSLAYKCKHGPIAYSNFDRSSKSTYTLSEYNESSNSSLFTLMDKETYILEWLCSNQYGSDRCVKLPVLESYDDAEAFEFITSLSRDAEFSEYTIAAMNANKMLPYFGNRFSVRTKSHLGSTEESLKEIVQELKEYFGANK